VAKVVAILNIGANHKLGKGFGFHHPTSNDNLSQSRTGQPQQQQQQQLQQQEVPLICPVCKRPEIKGTYREYVCKSCGYMHKNFARTSYRRYLDEEPEREEPMF
jgi:ribosomal protein L37AE/L43A